MALLSGQITVTTAGTAVQGPTAPDGKIFALKAHPSNVGSVWGGNDGADDVTNSTGFPLDPGEGVTIDIDALEEADGNNLSELWFDTDTNGNKVCWLLLE